MKVCACIQWKEYKKQADEIFSSAYIHGIKYSGPVFKFCPFCAEELFTDHSEDY